MNRKTLFSLFIVTGLLLAVALIAPAPRLLAQEGPDAALANAGTAFTYQGRIVFDGHAIDNELCSIIPTLWTAENGGSKIATGQTTVVRPSNGYFTMSIDFGEGAFDGGRRWLQLHVACVSDPNHAQGTTLPRIEITAAPYALGLVPGAYVRDASGSGSAFAATSGQTWNIPLLVATKVSAIWGDSKFDDGVMGLSQQGNGLYGYSETGKAVYADGDAHVEGKLTWKAKRSVISIPASAFIPEQLNDAGYVPYDNEGYYLKNESAQDEWYTAPVQLPQGAVIKQLNVGWRDGSDSTATLSLRRRSFTDFTAQFDTMGVVHSVGSLHTIREGVWSDDAIALATVDNGSYAYYLEVTLPPNSEDIKLYGVTIVYEVSEPY